MKSNKTLNVIIAGTQTFKDYDLVCTVMKVIREKYENIRIISSSLPGADKCGILYALENKLPYMVFEAEWKKYGRTTEIIRHEQMVKVSQVLVLFWDGDSPGSQDLLHLAIQYELDCYVMLYPTMSFYSGKKILDKLFDDLLPF